MAFKTFDRDHEAVNGEDYLRADYSLPCGTSLHIFFQFYAALMILVSRPAGRESGHVHLAASLVFSLASISEGLRVLAVFVKSFCLIGMVFRQLRLLSLRLNYSDRFVVAAKVYPVGIPILYAVILWKNRELLNPRIHTKPVGADEAATRGDPTKGDGNPSATRSIMPKGQTKQYSPEELQMLEEKVKARKKHPELVPSMFLWKDFGEIGKGSRENVSFSRRRTRL